jgi:hypothetical protein
MTTPLKLTDCYHCVAPGWAAILTMMHVELEAICPEYEALQVKEKFGGLRAYISVPHDAGINPDQAVTQALAYAVEHKYEALSNRVCEICGELGENKQDKHNWYTTLCNVHRDDQ